MSIKRMLWVCLAFLSTVSSPVAGQPGPRPKIGLTLSGGGAKGLAHIGILKAIDSAGLKIDYITGTSMGSIIGGLYAAGYTADSIESITRSINWDMLLSNQSSLRSLFMEEKDEYYKYTMELPWVNSRFQLRTGFLEGQELWLKLSELFFPVYSKKDFSQLSIPFKCIGTDVSNGEAIVLDSGEISSAIRASMAIPSFFTAVDLNGRKLVDGGIVRNFPVRDVKKMGADIIIGSNVAGGLLPTEKIRNPMQVMMQVAFFREAQDHKEEVKLCNIFVSFHLAKYSMASFGQASEILEAGIEEGRKLYPKFKRLADSLNAIYGPAPFQEHRLPEAKQVKLSSADVNGLVHTSQAFFLHTVDFAAGKAYTAGQISRMVRLAFGTRYYDRIVYALQPQPDSSCRIVFSVKENPLTFAKAGLHYNKFSNVALILNLTARNYFITNSRSMLTLNLGESFRTRAEHLQYIGRRKNFSFSMLSQYDRFDVTTYTTYKQDGLYKQQFVKLDGRFQYSTMRNLSINAGYRYEWIYYRPAITSSFQFSGQNGFPTMYAGIIHNSLDRTIYPRHGVKLELEGGIVGQQHPAIHFFINARPPANPDSLEVSNAPYRRLALNAESYLPFSRHTTLSLSMQSGVNFNYQRNIMNEFSIGGLTRLFRNQVTFAGLQEGSIYTPAMAAFAASLRYELFNNTFITGRANVLFENFVSTSAFFQNPDFLSGYALTFGYNFALGPLEFSLMYCDQSRKIGSYVNIGIPF